MIRASYKLLNLHSYFTAGEKEVRGWTIKIGDSAYDAAGQIHSDFQKGFICAEVISYKDYIKSYVYFRRFPSIIKRLESLEKNKNE